MAKTKKLIIIGTSAFAEIAHEYFTHDSDYEVVGFSAEKAFITNNEFRGLKVYPFEELEQHFKPNDYYFFAALTYLQLNKVRTRLFQEAKAKGFKPASYISSRSFVWRNVELGEHCFIFEDNTIQPFVKVGDNVIMWSGNHIGHHSTIGNNCFISSHVVICGLCNIGDNCFFAVNSVVANNVNVANDCFINSGANVMKHTQPMEIHNAAPSTVAGITSHKLFKVKNYEMA